jgi:hypothetical protein
VDFNSFKTNSKLENSGVWVKCGNGEILLASKTSETYKKVIKRLLQPHETSIALGIMTEEESDILDRRCTAEGLILDWKGFTENGQEIVYSSDNAFRLLGEAKAFRKFVDRECASLENFREKKEEIETKNS